MSFLSNKEIRLQIQIIKKKRTYNIFSLLLLEQNITKKKWIDENIMELNNKKDSKKNKVEVIFNSTVYAIKSKSDHLLKLYYLVYSKGYLKEKNI